MRTAVGIGRKDGAIIDMSAGGASSPTPGDVEHYVFCGTESASVLACAQRTDGRVELRQSMQLAIPAAAAGASHGAPGGVAVEWVMAHPSGKWLYAGLCSWDHAPGEIHTLAIGADGELGKPTTPPVFSGGYQPCEMKLFGGRWLAVPNYLSGHVAVLDVAKGPPAGDAPTCVLALPDLRAGPAKKGQGSSPFVGVPGGFLPLCHGVAWSPDGAHLVAVDAGQARLVSLRFSAKSGTLAIADSFAAADPAVSAESWLLGAVRRLAGHRPRHAAFSADGRALHVVYEAANALCAHAFDAATGKISPAAWKLPLTSAMARGPRCCELGPMGAAAEVGVHTASGTTFVSFRGLLWSPSALVSFGATGGGAAARTAELALPAGCNPRHFCFDASQRLLVLGRVGGVEVYEVDASGALRLRASSELGPVDAEALKANGKLEIDCVALVPPKPGLAARILGR